MLHARVPYAIRAPNFQMPRPQKSYREMLQNDLIPTITQRLLPLGNSNLTRIENRSEGLIKLFELLPATYPLSINIPASEK